MADGEEDEAEAEDCVEYIINAAVEVEAVVVGSGGKVDDKKKDSCCDCVSELACTNVCAFLNVELAVFGGLSYKEGNEEEQAYI